MIAHRTTLVLDESLLGLKAGLESRGIPVVTVADLGVTATQDVEVLRAIDNKVSRPWVLMTTDLTMVEEAPGFDWSRHAIAWIKPPEGLKGIEAEHAKNEVAQRHAHTIEHQQPGQHFTYRVNRYYRHPPAFVSRW